MYTKGSWYSVFSLIWPKEKTRIPPRGAKITPCGVKSKALKTRETIENEGRTNRGCLMALFSLLLTE